MASESSAAASNGVHDPTLSEPASPRTPNGGAVSKSAAGHSRAQEKFEVKAVSVPYGREREGVVYYIVNVEDTNSKKWSIEKRYSAFERLHSVLTELFAHRGFPPGADLPPKKFKFFVSHVSEHFIEERRCLLDSYLNKMLKVPDVVKSDVWLEFFSSDALDDYVEPPQETAIPDDCEITSVSIPQTRLMSDHVLFQVDVMNAKKRRTFQKWTVLKRFNQFFELDAQLRTEFAENERVLALMPASPQRQSKLLYDHMDLNFVESRRVLLENWMHKLLHIKEVVENATFLGFLGVQL